MHETTTHFYIGVYFVKKNDSLVFHLWYLRVHCAEKSHMTCSVYDDKCHVAVARTWRDCERLKKCFLVVHMMWSWWDNVVFMLLATLTGHLFLNRISTRKLCFPWKSFLPSEAFLCIRNLQLRRFPQNLSRWRSWNTLRVETVSTFQQTELFAQKKSSLNSRHAKAISLENSSHFAWYVLSNY